MNWTIFALGTLFFIEQNRYFGWNTTPQSDAELIADGLSILLMSLAVFGRDA